MSKILSIIVPMYNSEAFLPKCVESLLHQDIPLDNYEIILVNDGSPDGSKTLAEDYASKYSNIVVLSQENKGTSGARNTGLRYDTSKYVYFVDPDDYILENSLQVVLEKMEEESLDVLRFGYTEVDELYRPTMSCKHPETPDYSSAIMDGPTFMAKRLGVACYVWTFIFRTAIIKENDIFFIEGDYFDDTPWLPRVLLNAEKVDSIDIKRHFYLIRSNSLVRSNNDNNYQRIIEGQVFLIDELIRQKNSCNNENAEKWYDCMLAHCVISLLSLASIYKYEKHNLYINLIDSYKLRPLSTDKSNNNSKIKTILINLSPKLYCWMLYLKNKC